MCVGDCNADGAVTINELIVGVNIALEAAPLNQCPSFDTDHSGTVTVAELITAVNSALNGCPPDTAGVLLQGPPDMLAVDAVHDLDHEGGAPGSELSGEGGRMLIRTRIEIGFTQAATVGQVNTLLDSVGGRIVLMLENVPIVSVRIPDPGSVEALNTLVGHLAADPIVHFVNKGYLARPAVLPDNFSLTPVAPDFTTIDHQLAVRAPAAWNARKAIRTARQPTVVLQDYFGAGPPLNAPAGGFDVRIDAPGDFATYTRACTNHDCTVPPGCSCEHGYHVAGVIAASFGGMDHCHRPFVREAGRDCATGIFPGTTPLRVVDHTLLIGQDQGDDKTILILKNLAVHGVNGILNTSLGNSCAPGDDTCVPSEVAVKGALEWIVKVRLSGLEGRFLHLTAAGNVFPEFPDDHDASEGSSYSAAALVRDLQSDGVAVPNLTNVLVIENAISTPGPPYEIGCLNSNSFIGGHLTAIGTTGSADGVWSLTDPGTGFGYAGGTSNATPQVAGLANYVWALAPELTPQQVAGVLLATARTDFAYSLRSADNACYDATVPVAPAIDAYDAVLSLDAAALPDRTDAPVRLAILDVDDDGDFDADDLLQFVTMYIDPHTGHPREPERDEWSRWDLNGDGATGGVTFTAHFDLDRVFSTQYGLSHYDPVTQPIEGVPILFEENNLTDLEILCYYAYSALFTGAGGTALTDADRQRRVERLDPLSNCMEISMEVVFPTTIAPGTDTLLVVRVLNDLGRVPIVGLPIELTPSGGTVDQFAGVTDADGFFQTKARLFAGQPELIIDVIARAGGGGPELKRTTVTAKATAVGGVVRLRSSGLVSAITTHRCDPYFRRSPDGVTEWSDSISCSGVDDSSGEPEPQSASATASFTEHYEGSNLVSVTASGVHTASNAAGGVDYELSFSVEQTTTIAIEGQVTGDELSSRHFGFRRLRPETIIFNDYSDDEPGPINDMSTLGAGDYVILISVGTQDGSASFNLSVAWPVPIRVPRDLPRLVSFPGSAWRYVSSSLKVSDVYACDPSDLEAEPQAADAPRQSLGTRAWWNETLERHPASHGVNDYERHSNQNPPPRRRLRWTLHRHRAGEATQPLLQR